MIGHDVTVHAHPLNDGTAWYRVTCTCGWANNDDQRIYSEERAKKTRIDHFAQQNELDEIELLDEATDFVRQARGYIEALWPCKNGHFECAPWDRGPCEAEAVAAYIGRKTA